MANISPPCVIMSSVNKHGYRNHKSANLELRDDFGMLFMYNILYIFFPRHHAIVMIDILWVAFVLNTCRSIS